MRLYLIRHGETQHNRRKVMQGHAEVPLNDHGIAQATRLAERMKIMPLDCIYASDLRRTTMTACVLASHTGAPLVYDEGFRERDPGELTNKPYEESMGFFTDIDYTPPGGESFPEFDARVRAAFDRLLETEGRTERNVAVVSHGMACGAFLRSHLGYSRERLSEMSWPNTCLSILDYADEWKVVKLGCAEHLEGLEADDAPRSGAAATGA